MTERPWWLGAGGGGKTHSIDFVSKGSLPRIETVTVGHRPDGFTLMVKEGGPKKIAILDIETD